VKATLPLALVAALITSGLPVNCQERVESANGPIGRATTRQAFRLASQPDSDAQRTRRASDAAWSRVRMLNPGAEITLTTNRQQSGKRYVLSADESGVLVLNLSDRSIPTCVIVALRATAVDHPQYFLEAEQGKAIALDRNIGLEREGVFFANRNIARLDQLVERVDRAQIVELRAPYGHPITNSIGIGIGIGMGAGVVTRDVNGLAWGGVLGAAAGFMVGSMLVSNRDDDKGVVIYPK